MKGRDLPSYIHRRKRDGVLIFAKRIGGRVVQVRLQTQFPEGEPVPFALHQEREQLLHMRTPAPLGRDMSSVIRRYETGPKFGDLKPRTRADYAKRMEFLKRKIGHLEPRHITRRHVIEWLEAWARKSPHEANYRLAVLKVLLERAIDYGLIAQNPAKGVGAVRYEKRDREPWPEGLIKDFRKSFRYDTRQRLCFELLLGTGQRIGDVLRMQWGHVRDGGIEVKQGKTGKRLWVPLTDHLRACLDVAPRRGLTILTTAQGRPMSYSYTADEMRAAREAVGALDYDLHGLRYAACVELFLAGCTDDEISAITGQSPAMVLHYTRHVRQKVLALRAKEKRG